MPLSERHQRFMEAVESLKLRFPGQEIAKKTGYNKATVSSYLREKEPSENFVKTFAQHFGFDFAEIWLGVRIEKDNQPDQPAAEPTPMQILDRLSLAFVEQAKALADQAEGFKSQAQAFKAQGELVATIRNEMARESTLARMEPNLKRTLAAALVVAKGQEDAMKELRGLLPSPVRKKAPSRGGGKGGHRIDGGSEKKGKTPA